MARPAKDVESATFGWRLRTLRELRGVSQRWVAREADLSDSYLCQLERGQTQPSAAILRRLADVFGVTMDELWQGLGRCEADVIVSHPGTTG